MNILVLNYEFPPIGGGASPVAYDISKLLAKDHHVTVVTMAFTDLPRFEIVDGINIYRVPCLRSKAFVCHPWEQLTYIFSAMHFLKKHLKEHSYSVVHTHFIIPTGIISYWLKKKYHLNYVITAHGSDVIGHNNNRFKILYFFIKKPWISIVKNSHTIISPSLYLSDRIKESCTADNCCIIPNGIFTSDYKPLPKKKKILVLSRLQETKNIQLVIQSFKNLAKEDWHLDIVGDGPYKNNLIKLCQDLDITTSVTFHGWLKNKSPQHLQLLGECYALVSASQFENYPVVVIEAIASHTYPILSDISAHRQFELGEDHYFKTNSVDMLTEKLKLAIVAYPQPYSTDVFCYDWENIVNQYTQILDCASQL